MKLSQCACSIKKFLRSATALLGLGLLVISFQNCGGNFKAALGNTDNNFGKQIVPTSANELASASVVDNASNPLPTAAATSNELTARNDIYNFVAGDKTTCEESIRSRLNLTFSCAVGAGCSIDGYVPSSSKPSANPQLYGACITPQTLATIPDSQRNQPAQAALAYNFVAFDQATCEASVLSRLGLVRTCSVGGGCSLDGQIPTGSNPSANPQHWGLCLFQ